MATLGGLAIVAFIFPVNVYIGKKQLGIQKYILTMKGKRVRLINEILSGIKVIYDHVLKELSYIKKYKQIVLKPVCVFHNI